MSLSLSLISLSLINMYIQKETKGTLMNLKKPEEELGEAEPVEFEKDWYSLSLSLFSV